ncbi:MAG TPA: VOC family protein, partial [Mycobacterium sp.]|nr:VOC family protein [Mycobacterium sp.]
MPELMGISHVDLTVSDCERAAAWWQDIVGFTLVNRTRGETFETRTLVHPSGVAVTVMTHDETVQSGLFDERRIGLDHLAGFQLARARTWWTVMLAPSSLRSRFSAS